MQFLSLRSTFRALRRPLITCCLVIAISPILLQQAQAGFIGDYAVTNFVLTNSNANGSAMSPDGGSTLIITGPNTGSGLSGTTDFTVFAASAGLLQFQYLYSSLDAPGFDYAGYLLGPNFVQFADTDGQSASVSINVASGQLFGFRVGSADNTGEPGILTISSLTTPGSVPEPGTLGLTLTVGGAICFARRRQLAAAARKETRA